MIAYYTQCNLLTMPFSICYCWLLKITPPAGCQQLLALPVTCNGVTLKLEKNNFCTLYCDKFDQNRL